MNNEVEGSWTSFLLIGEGTLIDFCGMGTASFSS